MCDAKKFLKQLQHLVNALFSKTVGLSGSFSSGSSSVASFRLISCFLRPSLSYTEEMCFSMDVAATAPSETAVTT